MSSGDDCAATDPPVRPSAGPVPVGWERKVEEGSVRYISPSGTALTSLEQTYAYLLADGTCKCGLECPLNMHKVFNFDPGASVAGRGAPGAQGQQDMTKLCNHRRKTAAMATLYRSMEGAAGPCRPGTGPGLSLLFSAEGHLAAAPGTSVPPPSAGGSFPSVPLGAKTPEATSAPMGTWLIAPPFLQPHDIVPGANDSPKSHLPASPCFGLCLPQPDTATPPRSPGVPLTEGTRSQRPAGRTSSWAAPSQGATGESPDPGGPGQCLPATTSAPQATTSAPRATTSAPQAGKADSPVSDALTTRSSNNPPVPLDAVPEGRGVLGLPPAGTPFPASSLLSLAAKAQLGSPDPLPTPSTLPPCPCLPCVLLSLVGEWTPGRGAQWSRRPNPPDPAAPRVPPEPKGTHAPVTAQPLAALLNLLGAQGCPEGGGPGEPALLLGSLPATHGSLCPGTGLLTAGRDFSEQLRGLFGQLAAPSEPTSGTSPWAKASGHDGGPGAAASPGVPKGTVAPGAGSNGEGGAGGALGCPPPPESKPAAFAGQEQALALGGCLPPGLLLGTLPFSVALGQHPPACGGDPEGPSLPSLLAASLLPLPLGIPLPTLDLKPSPGTLLSTLLPLPSGLGERGPEAPAPDPEGCAVLPDQPLLFSALPASLALRPTLLAAGLGPPEPAPATPPSSLASPSAAPTSTGTPPTTTEAPCGEGRAPDSPSGTLERLNPLGPHRGSSLLGATLLGNLPALSPLLQNQPLLPPMLPPPGVSLGPGSPLGTASPMAGLLQSLQLGPRFNSPEKSAAPLGPSAGASPSPPAPPGLPEGTPSALEPSVPCQAELGSSRPSRGARGCLTPRPPLKRGRRRAEARNGGTPVLGGSPSTKSPRCGAGRGSWGAQRHFHGQAGDRGEKGLPPAAPPAPHPAWRCKGDVPGADQQLRVEEIKGSSPHLRPSCRGWRRKASTPQPSARPETLRQRGLSASAGAGPTADLAVAQHPWPGRPVKTRRRKLPT